jgi:hypothetical protein
MVSKHSVRHVQSAQALYFALLTRPVYYVDEKVILLLTSRLVRR